MHSLLFWVGIITIISAISLAFLSGFPLNINLIIVSAGLLSGLFFLTFSTILKHLEDISVNLVNNTKNKDTPE